MTSRVNVRGRSLAVFATSVGLLVGSAGLSVLASGPARSLAPAEDCAAAFPVADLEDGDVVDGLTVSSGTTPDPFTGEVLGVLEGGIAPGLDMVLVRLTSAEIDRVGGIWAGMSGSPVYAEDGRLIGAVAYGLSAGPSTVAGVTPFEDMDDYLDAERPGRVEVDTATARRIAQRTEVSRREASEGLRQLPMPTGVSGVAAARFGELEARPYLQKSSYAMGRASDGASSPDDIVAGGNIAASLSYGDITQAGVGTATSICNGRVVAFGHPMTFLGETTMSLHPADALYVQEDPTFAPFKVANPGLPAGTITDDHLTGISGGFGALPQTSSVVSTVSFAGRSRTGESHVSVEEATASTVFYQILSNHDRIVDAITSGSETVDWTVSGTDADGSNFALAFSDRYASLYDIASEGAFELADLAYRISTIEGVTIDSVTSDATASEDSSTYELGGFEQYRDGAWRAVGKGEPATVDPGKMLRLRVTLVGPAGETHLPYTVRVPKKLAGTKATVEGVGGAYLFPSRLYSNSIDKIAKAVSTMARNDEVKFTFTGFSRRSEVTSNQVTGPVDKVVLGQSRVKVVVSGEPRGGGKGAGGPIVCGPEASGRGC